MGALNLPNTTTSTSTTTGALTVGGGLGIAGNAYIGGTISIAGGSPAAGKVLTSDANGLASWTAPTVSSIGAISGTSTANGASITSGVFNLAPADGTNGGVVTTGTQTFAGAKTFSSTIVGSINGNAATVTTNASLTGPITSVGNATSVASQTGTGTKFVMDTSPTLVTPVLGAATGTSLSVSGQLTSTVVTGTAPLVVSSTTVVANLNIGGNAATSTTATNIAGGDAGSLPYQTAAATTAMLAKGTDGQVLVLASGVPKWSNNIGGGVLAKTDTYDILATDSANLLVYSGSAASKTIKLPSAVTVGAGREITIKNIASVSVTITAAVGNLISDSTTTTATSLSIGIEPSNNWIKAISDGTNWIILRALF